LTWSLKTDFFCPLNTTSGGELEQNFTICGRFSEYLHFRDLDSERFDADPDTTRSIIWTSGSGAHSFYYLAVAFINLYFTGEKNEIIFILKTTAK